MTAAAQAEDRLEEHLADRLRDHLHRGGADLALEFGTDRYSWDAVGDVAAGLGRQLARLGIAQDERVGLIARSRPSHVATVWALLALRRCGTMIYGFQSAEKIADDVRALRCPLLLIDADDWSPVIAAAARDAGSAVLLLGPMSLSPAEGFEAVSPSADRSPREGVALQMLSSGTTGRPKRIDMPMGTLAASALSAAAQLDQLTAPDQIGISIFPLCNISGLYTVVPYGLGRRPLAILERFQVKQWVELVRRHRPASADLPPAAIAMILSNDVPRDHLASIRMIRSGAAPLDPAIHDAFEERFGIPVALSYGASEFCGIVTTWTADDLARHRPEKRFSAGRPITGVAIRVVDSTGGAELPPGESGLLEVRAERVGPDWIRTNDLVDIDDDGFLWFRGRADDAIMRGGFKIVPADVETVLRLHPSIRDAAVVGLPDGRLGAVPAALVELRRSDGDIDEAAVREWSRRHLAAFQIPAVVRFVDALPRTPSMKVSREAVKAMLAG
ncbi:hypothetical protein BSL82_11890 [Tardibacter chloracetimidivorans]|uniref:AMP-dependent synthetase n=1 Tax=Tardibacter chloracetimidivorans TaxID=1921510 RepID=A0A1L3ZWB7_9SPHN|nr:fatty acid--CoA ligase family protein [Tardibacter chloracetimidivorans]API59924.1 hypothetical protein BSL82_11890 [Tardibacter chloracetimidivorans]